MREQPIEAEPRAKASQPPPPSTLQAAELAAPPASARPLASVTALAPAPAPAPAPSTLTALPERGIGIRVKLIGLMVATIFGIVGVLATYFPAQQITELRTYLRTRAEVYVGLASLQLRSSVAFDDRETAREVLGAIAKDPLIDGLTLYTEQCKALHAEGALSALARDPRLCLMQERAIFYLPGRVLAVAPVQSLEGPRGTVVLEISTLPASAARNRLVRTALLVGSGALLLGAAAAWLIARSLALRVERIASATSAMARGELEQAIDVSGPNDEIGVLARGFNAMSRRLRELVAHIQESAREESARLEQLVADRTRELDRRNQDLRLVLDNVEQGFLTIDRDALVVGEHSLAIEHWVGALDGKDTLWHALCSGNPERELDFKLAWSQVSDGLLPLEVTLDQMPKTLQLGARHLRLEYKALGGDDFEKLMVVLSDVTAIVERERSEEENREVISLTSHLLHDRAGFLEFCSETQSLFERVTRNRSDVLLLRRDLHTLKGNTAIYGMSAIARECHALETQLAHVTPEALDRTALGAQWQRSCAKIKLLLPKRAQHTLEVEETDYAAALTAIRAGSSAGELERMLSAWRLEPIKTRLARIAVQLRALAGSLGKGDVQVEVDAPALFLAREELSEFWAAFSHVVRNAAVHGLETPEARRASGKPKLARFGLRAGIAEKRLFLELADSGPGVDWDSVRKRAIASKLPHASQADLERALFVDGITTREDVSENAGRGVGLSAVRAACERQRGEIRVQSTLGKGATWRFSWPVSELRSLISHELEVAS